MAETTVTVAQLKAARALLGWTQSDLWTAALKVSSRETIAIVTLKRIEAATGPLSGPDYAIEAIVTALEKAGVEFIDQGRMSRTGGAGVRLIK